MLNVAVSVETTMLLTVNYKNRIGVKNNQTLTRQQAIKIFFLYLGICEDEAVLWTTCSSPITVLQRSPFTQACV
jgi:hypothetical protein